jgi:hypothetical protein
MAKRKQERFYSVRGRITEDVEFLVYAMSAEDAADKVKQGDWSGVDRLGIVDFEATGQPEAD